MQNRGLKHQLADVLQPQQSDEQKVLDGEEEEEEELDVTIEGVEEDEEEESLELWDAWDSELSLSQTNTQIRDEPKKKTANRPESLHLHTDSSQVDVTGPDSTHKNCLCE